MADAGFHVLVTIRAAPGNLNEVRELGLDLAESTRGEQGCVRYDLVQSTTEPEQFALIEEWEREEDYARHLASPRVSAALKRASGIVEGAPEIHTFRVARARRERIGSEDETREVVDPNEQTRA